MNHRLYSKTTMEEIKQCFDMGLSLRQTAEKLNCSPQGLRQACSLLDELNLESRKSRINRQTRANDPFGLGNKVQSKHAFA